MQDAQKDIASMLPDQLAAELRELGQAPFRAKQVFDWLSKGTWDFSEMRNLPMELRGLLGEQFRLYAPQVLRKQVSQADGTVKYLWRLWDGNAVESVVMRYSYGNTVCISSQVGCRQGCVFCASTGLGFKRDLTAGEMLAEVLFSQIDSDLPISGIVLMGIGEPLENYEQVLRFLRLANHPQGMNIGMRHISLSTCGLVPEIRRLAEENLQLTLSVSLHAPDDETRRTIMPIARKYDMETLIDCCADYFRRTERRISFEYALIKGLNDAPWQAEKLAAIMRRTHGHLNLIPLNRVEGSPLIPGDAKSFADMLKKLGVNVTVRRRLGADIDAACGQLRRKEAT